MDAEWWWKAIKEYLDRYPFDREYVWQTGRVSGVMLAGALTTSEADELKAKIKAHRREHMKPDPLNHFWNEE